jgi:thymidylate kinase
MSKQHHFHGFLIAIEGIDGAGKSTQAHFVQDRLQERKLCVMQDVVAARQLAK